METKKNQGLNCENELLCRVIGAIIIIVGLYMVLWGKSKDQRGSESSEKVLASPSATTEETMIEMNETVKIPNQELVVTIMEPKEDQDTNQLDETKHNMI